MDQVFLTGFSTGAFLAYTLACSNPVAYRGVAVNAGSIGRGHIDECKSINGSVDVIGFHSLADPTVPWNGTLAWASQPEVEAVWKHRNGCTGTEPGQITFNSSTSVCTLYECPGAHVEQCNVIGLDHCWIGGRSGGFAVCEARPGDVDVTQHMFRRWDALVASDSPSGGERQQQQQQQPDDDDNNSYITFTSIDIACGNNCSSGSTCK